MEDCTKAILFFGGVLALIALGASLIFCVALAGIFPATCSPLLDFVIRTLHSLANLVKS